MQCLLTLPVLSEGHLSMASCEVFGRCRMFTALHHWKSAQCLSNITSQPVAGLTSVLLSHNVHGAILSAGAAWE